ncbi:hypothetical protein DIE16_31320 [Burkholderia sp. Bp9090]|uniref:hypothetical protein n=1 Tax=Burkholderia sp. Bp9090 TaxID=2184567 RepID=UPI000F5F94A5|nr:hypothetical protein [Burkholderia sp. Bp9090]RQZ27465.1 hypothetical protein DIE16_31320 [Burkholderia sp. Bp9090]
MTDEKKDINEIHAEFWQKRKKQTDELLSHVPIAKMAYAVYQSQVKYTPFDQQKPYDLTVDMAATLAGEHVEALRSVVNSVNASAPRPRSRSHRNIVIEVMKRALREDMTLPQFLENMAEERDGVEIKPIAKRGVTNLYTVFCAELVPVDEEGAETAKAAATKQVTLKSLEGWFTAARKP